MTISLINHLVVLLYIRIFIFCTDSLANYKIDQTHDDVYDLWKLEVT